MGDRYVISDDKKKILYIDAHNLYGWAMNQSLPFDEIKFVKALIEDIFNTLDYSDIGYFLEFDLKYPDDIKKKTKKTFHFDQKISLLPKISSVII